MPIVGNETAEYGYEGENRHFVSAFVDGVQPELGFSRRTATSTELLMACYMSAEQERVLRVASGRSRHLSAAGRSHGRWLE